VEINSRESSDPSDDLSFLCICKCGGGDGKRRCLRETKRSVCRGGDGGASSHTRCFLGLPSTNARILTGSSSWLPTSSPAGITTTGSPPKRPHPRFPHLPISWAPGPGRPAFSWLWIRMKLGGNVNVKFRSKCKCRTFYYSLNSWKVPSEKKKRQKKVMGDIYFKYLFN